MTSLRAIFTIVFLFFVATASAYNYVDCNLVSSDVYNIDTDQLYTHVPFEYERNYYYNFTLSPLQEPVVVGLQLANSRGSTNLTTTLWVNDQLVEQETPEDILSVPIFFLNTACGTQNHIKFITADSFSLYLNGRRVRYESCRYSYELFLYNPPCQTVQNIYF